MKYLKLYEEITQYKKITIDLLLTNLYKNNKNLTYNILYIE